jgi:hypothetical protein
MNQDLQAQQPPPGAGAPQRAPFNSAALMGFIFAFVFAPVGLILSIIAKKKISRSGGTLGGGGLALGGIIVGAIFSAIYLLYIVAIAASM